MKDIETYPVTLGSIWQVGRHVLACGDIEGGNGEPLLRFYHEHSLGRTPALVYVDPPWTQALATNFRRRAGLENPVTFRALICRLLTLIRKADCLAFIEIGKPQHQHLLNWATAAGYVAVGSVPITYYKTRPCYLCWASPASGSEGARIAEMLRGKDDDHTPELAIREATVPGGVVFDPCLGQGLTALSANRASRVCLGMELNPKRLSTALVRLERAGAGTPHQIGDLYSV